MIAWETEIVPQFCTCGAQLVEDARFCHKCAKPTRDEFVFVEDQPPAPVIAPPPPVPVEPPPIGLKNGLAIRIALSSCALCFLLAMVSGQLGMPPVLLMMWFVAAGFFAVFLYRMRTRRNMSAMSGAALGWIAGLFLFVFMLAIFAAQLSGPTAWNDFREALKSQHRTDAEINQVMDLMRSPAGMGVGVVLSFLVVTSLPAFGGAICAKLFPRRD